MAELVREHTGQLALADDVEDPARHRDDRVLRVAAGGERVRRGLIDDEDPRRGKSRGLGDAADDPIELRRLSFGHRFRARERERDAVAEPPGAEIQDERDEERGHHRVGAEEPARCGDEDQREERKEPDDLDCVEHSEVSTPDSVPRFSQGTSVSMVAPIGSMADGMDTDP